MYNDGGLCLMLPVSIVFFLFYFLIISLSLQYHIRVLESAPEVVALLLAGLEYLINISYVDDTEVFKVCKLSLSILCCQYNCMLQFFLNYALMCFARV